MGVFPITGEDEKDDGTNGSGLTQLLWSACGRYLCTVERVSDGIAVWDIRGTGKKLAWLKGRKAKTQQRLGVDVTGGEVWAGGTDGSVRVWDGLGQAEGIVDPNWEFQAHEDAITSTALHPIGSVLLTSSGQRHSYIDITSAGNVTGNDTVRSEVPGSTSRSSRSLQSLLSLDVEHSSAYAFDNSMKIWAL